GMIAMAMNPKNGEILGMSSRPSFEPADFQRVSTEVYNRNLPVWSTDELGSTKKIITLAVSWNVHLVYLEKDTFDDDEAAVVVGARLRC
ncbi:penicillin-binding transpeptidase domain-containing protein, partial [Bacillus mycoides]|uniref:penicillin-binding transpeptidase domain-containing protein n=1 Tax=Bacillus mycoides TaxID=1405 RepID=UPI00284A25AB